MPHRISSLLREIARWRRHVPLHMLYVPIAMAIMHRWPGRDVIRRTLRLALRRRVFEIKLTYPDTVRLRGRFCEHADLHAFQEVFVDRVYTFETLAATPAVIVDAGAHLGSFSILAAKTYPQAKVIAFEPDAGNFALLRYNVARNRLLVESENAALSDYDGHALISGPTSMGRAIGASTGEEVVVRRLGTAVGLESASPLLLKLDVEGSEWRILEESASALPNDTCILAELHAGTADVERIGAFASRWGFDCDITNHKGQYVEVRLRRGGFLRNHEL